MRKFLLDFLRDFFNIILMSMIFVNIATNNSNKAGVPPTTIGINSRDPYIDYGMVGGNINNMPLATSSTSLTNIAITRSNPKKRSKSLKLDSDDDSRSNDDREADRRSANNARERHFL